MNSESPSPALGHAEEGKGLGQAQEGAVLVLAINGDDAAFSELVRRRQSWLRNLLRRLCRDRVLADDLAQQVFIQAWRSLRTLRSANAFGAWLRRLAINAWLAHVRSQRTAEVPEAELQGRVSGIVLQGSVSNGDPQEIGSSAMQSQHQLDLDRALAYLPGDERLCVVLAYSEGMSHSEICETTGLPLGTVKSHIRRGAERLRVLLDAYRPAEVRHVR